ncbi:hypothetical protein PNEG_01255 [Pneumocystis murina B123]|uniref:ATP-dependent DNA helicase II subunit 2 n=1 Tax=Pneumocystis murina (strain B123) TaxID=1069680 RepID=M7PJB4_PNEMU|nr:hypothetical protein PNEG_01255 [Pneumocystis murina B123]EMR10549.1 hypothetical protein PNEG_01255 [Pneumocystis murina B123]
MSEKEVTVFVIDLDKRMKNCENNRTQSNLEWVLSYFWNKISSKVLSGRKTDCVGVVGFKTDETNNDMEDDKFYENISVLCPIQQITIKEIKELKKQLIPSNTDVGDAISAVIIGIDLISKYCRNLKYIKNLILITNGESDMNFSDLEKIAYQIRYMSINFSIFGIDFDTNGYKEVAKNTIKLNNEKNLLKFSNISNGTFSSMVEAIDSLNIPSVKKIRPISLFGGILSIGYSQNYSNVIEIMVQRYPRTRLAKMPAAHRYNVSGIIPKSTDYNKESTKTSTNLSDDDKNECFNEILTTKSYKIEEDGDEKEISKEDLELGYIYGKTIVPVNIIDEEEMVYKEDTGLTILGFIKNKSFPRFIALGEANIIVPAKANLNAKISLSSLVHAMLKTNTLALARIVTKANKFPEMIIMAPSIENNFECLIELTLPFLEDCKNFKFPSIKKDNILSNKKGSSMKDIDTLMEKYVTKMDLSNKTQDNNIKKTSQLKSMCIYNIALYRLNQAISSAAIYPDLELKNLLPDIKQFMYPSDDLLKRCEEEIKTLSELCNIKETILTVPESTVP